MTNTNTNTNTNGETKIVHFSGQRIPVPAHLSIEDIKAGLSAMFPRIADAHAIQGEDGSIRFFVEAGEKGSDEPSTPAETPSDTKIVHFSGQRIPVPAHLSIEDIKAGLSAMFPRIADAHAIVGEDGSIRFFVEAGEKGSDEPSTPSDTKIVHFSGQRIPVPAHLSIEDIKAGLSAMFPRIADAHAIVGEDGSIRFFVEAGEKGSDEPSTPAETPSDTKIVHFSGQRIPVPAHLSIEDIKAGLSAMFPRIADAHAIVGEDGSIRFFVEAGEKGSDEPSSPADTKIVHFSGQRIPVPAHLSIEDIKAGLSAMFPRIADAHAIVGEDGSIRFFVEAGEKGFLTV